MAVCEVANRWSHFELLASKTELSTAHLRNDSFTFEGRNMLGTILLIVLILMLIGAIPSWPHSRNWGYGPSGGLGLVVIIIIVLLLMGRL